MFPRVLVCQLDYHKCLLTPKISAQDSHYLRKLRTNLLGIYCANEDIIHCFFYDDSVGGAGPNEVISLLNYQLRHFQEKHGKYDQLIVWSDNAPGQFKECYLFFYLDYLVKTGQFLRVDLKFLLEGHSYSICDRRFGAIQQFFDKQERIEIPQQWAMKLKCSPLKNIEVHWVTVDMIMNYKSFLRMHYVPRSEDVNNEKLEVRKVSWINFGVGEIVDTEGKLTLEHHRGTAFVRFKMDPNERPRIVSFIKKKQMLELNPESLVPVRNKQKPINNLVKESCEKLARKYLSENAQGFYASLRAASNDDGSCSDDD